MNEQEFERLCYNQQEFASKSFLKGQAQSPENEALVDECFALDETLLDALNIEVPESLQSQLIEQKVETVPAKPRFNVTQVFSMAASFMVVIGASFWIWQQASLMQLEADVFAHLHNELFTLEKHEGVSTYKVNQLLAPYDVELKAPMDNVGFAEVCDIKNKKSVHLVLQRADAPVTVFIMPTETLKSVMAIEDRGYKGMIYPTKQGSVAILSTSEKAVKEVKSELDQQLTWDI